MRAAHIEHYSREYDRLSGRPVRRIEERFRDIDKHHPPKSPLTLAEAATRYIEDPSRAANAPKTFAASRFRLAAWVDLLGPDRPAAAIGRDEIRDALDVLLRLPANAVRKHPGVSLRKIADAGVADGQRKLNAASIEIYLRYLRSLFQYLVTEQVRADNPAAGIRGPKASRDKPRRPWTVDELNLFFHRPPFDRPWNGGRAGSSLFWVPLIALFSGAREGELAALRREDVFQQDGIWLIRLIDTDERRLKTAQSARAFPVHPAIVKAGFLEFLRSVPDGGPLFVDMPITKLGAAHWCQKQIGRHVRKIFTDPKVVLHSLRHNFRDAAREANLPLEVVGAIGGWKEGAQSAMAAYGAGPSAKNLAEWMAKIEYPGLKLEHLAPSTAAVPQVRYRQRPRRV